MYKIVENADGTATVLRGFNRTVVATHPTVADATAWIEDKILDADTDERARAKGLNANCHYCGAALVRGACRECGTEI